MYGAVIPSYKPKDSKAKEGKQEIIKVDDPRNKARVKKLFDTFD